MKKIGFIGAYDKIDFMLYVAKILTKLGKKVLVIDSTTIGKAKYIVPAISPANTYVTEFEGIDVSVGLHSIEQLKRRLNVVELPYDIALIDIDIPECIETFGMQTEKNYFVTSFDIYSLKKGLDTFSNLSIPITLTKVLFSKSMSKEENAYLDHLSLGYKVMWAETRIYFPLSIEDQQAIMENQKLAKINFKYLSDIYKDSLAYITEEILDDARGSDIKKTIKLIEKGA